jgi:arginase
MTDVLVDREITEASADQPGLGKTVSVLGVPLSYGQSQAGVHLGPAAIRVAGLAERIAMLAYIVNDRGDLPIEKPHSRPSPDDKAKYLPEIYEACERLASQTESIVEANELPVTIGGDHSIAIGSLSGVVKAFRKRNERIGLIYFDAHADMNTPDTTPSGNIHGMPLAALLGYGVPELVNVGGFAPKFDPRLCAHVGARDLDPGEKELIRRLGMRFFTMREIDERGVSVCVDEAIKIAEQGSGGFAVTFDVDVLDPRDAPGSGTLVRGGLSYREAHLAMEKIADTGAMRSLEVVEINTALDDNNRTSVLGVELILSALGKRIL